MLPKIGELIERYDNALKDEEDATITAINKGLDTGFDRLMRRINSMMRNREEADTSTLEAAAARARQLSGLLLARNPTKADLYQQAYERLSERATTLGLDQTSTLIRTTSPSTELQLIDIPIEAIQQAGTRSRTYLQRYGDEFANTATAETRAALAEGLDFPTLTNRLQARLGITKTRADSMARTESLSAFNAASARSLSKHGITLAIWYATKDDRTCPVCASRHGSIYRLEAVKAPCHPRCRCRLAPTSVEVLSATPLQRDLRKDFKSVRNKIVELGGSLDSGAAPFEDKAPYPVWTPRSRSNTITPS